MVIPGRNIGIDIPSMCEGLFSSYPPAPPSDTVKRLVEIDERIWEWTVHVCVHHPSVIMQAQDVSMQSGEPQQLSIEFWVKVVAKLNLTEDQVGCFWRGSPPTPHIRSLKCLDSL
jgi:hypothetical protein